MDEKTTRIRIIETKRGGPVVNDIWSSDGKIVPGEIVAVTEADAALLCDQMNACERIPDEPANDGQETSNESVNTPDPFVAAVSKGDPEKPTNEAILDWLAGRGVAVNPKTGREKLVKAVELVTQIKAKNGELPEGTHINTLETLLSRLP